MTDVRKRPEAERPSEVERRVPVVERPERRPPVRPEPSRFVRWMGWLMGIVLVAGIAGLVWWGLSTPEEVLVAPPIEQIDPHESPEIMRIPRLVTPPIEQIDPHESPEIMRIPRLVTPPLSQIDPHESPEIMRIPQVAAPSAEAFSFDVQTRMLLEANDGIANSAALTALNEQTRHLLEWNSTAGMDPFSRQTRILLEANDAIGD